MRRAGPSGHGPDHVRWDRAPARRKAAARRCRVKRLAIQPSVHPTVPSRGFMPWLLCALATLLVAAPAAVAAPSRDRWTEADSVLTLGRVERDLTGDSIPEIVSLTGAKITPD